MEILTRRIMIATRCRMIAFTTFISHIFARLQIHIPGKALLASTLRTDIAVGTTRTITLQNKSVFSVIIHIVLKFKYKKCIRVYHFRIDTIQSLIY